MSKIKLTKWRDVPDKYKYDPRFQVAFQINGKEFWHYSEVDGKRRDPNDRNYFIT